MKIHAAFFLLLLTFDSYSSEMLQLKSESKTIELVQIKKNWVSKSCAKKKCLALQKAKRSPAQGSGAIIKNPAAEFCTANNGEYLKVTRSNGNEDGLCQFKDGSTILAWNYYMRNKK
ncbi:MAG: DUF333 domain-containing protein [Bacteriovoracaceae bacterium]